MKKIEEKTLKHLAVCICVFTAIIFTMLIMSVIQKEFNDKLLNYFSSERVLESISTETEWSYNYNLNRFRESVDWYFYMWRIYASVLALLDVSLIIIYISGKKQIKKNKL